MFVVVVRHLESRPLEAALDVEALIGLAAVKDRLVAANLVGNEVEGLNQPKTQLLPLLILCDRDILDVGDRTETVDTDGRRVLAPELDRQRRSTASVQLCDVW